MMIDIMPDISVQHLPNIQQEKKGDGVGPRSVEETGNGNKSELDTDKQNATKNIYTKIHTYSATGDIAEEGPVENEDIASLTIDMTV